MKTTEIIGLIMVLIPIVGIYILTCYTSGFKKATIIWLVSISISLLIVVGMHLLTGENLIS